MPVNFVDVKEGVGIGLSKASETFTVVIFQRHPQSRNLGHLRDYLSPQYSFFRCREDFAFVTAGARWRVN